MVPPFKDVLSYIMPYVAKCLDPSGKVYSAYRGDHLKNLDWDIHKNFHGSHNSFMYFSCPIFYRNGKI